LSKKPVQLVIAIFENELGAEKTLRSLKAEEKDALQSVLAAVALQKNADNSVHYKDVGMTPTKGAVAGIVLGTVVGIATGGAGLALGALGGLLGGVMGKRKREGQITTEQVNQVIASIPAGSSALLAVVEQATAEPWEILLQNQGAQTFLTDISADLAAKLDQHGEAAHEALMSQINATDG